MIPRGAGFRTSCRDKGESISLRTFFLAIMGQICSAAMSPPIKGTHASNTRNTSRVARNNGNRPTFAWRARSIEECLAERSGILRARLINGGVARSGMGVPIEEGAPDATIENSGTNPKLSNCFGSDAAATWPRMRRVANLDATPTAKLGRFIAAVLM